MILAQIEIHKCNTTFQINLIKLYQFLQNNVKTHKLYNFSLSLQNFDQAFESQKQLFDFYHILENSLVNQNSQKISNSKFENSNYTQLFPFYANNNPSVTYFTQENELNAIENLKLKNKYLEALNKGDNKRHFQVYYVFKNKIKRMYRVDCMTRKINV